MLFFFISTFQNLYIFEQNSIFVLSNVPIVKSTKVCYEQLAHLYFAICFLTVPKMNRTVTSKPRYVPNRDFCVPLHPYCVVIQAFLLFYFMQLMLFQ